MSTLNRLWDVNFGIIREVITKKENFLLLRILSLIRSVYYNQFGS